MSDLLKSEKHPDVPYVMLGCKCSMCQRFGGPDNQPLPHMTKDMILNAARRYANFRQAFPADGWLDRIEQAGWELAEKVRAFDKQDAEFTAKIERGDYCPVCHNNPNQQGHGPRCTS